MNPKVTVLMTVYNGEKYLAECISSILGQTFSDFEFLIINDGSTDKTEEIIASFNDNRIKLVNNTRNLGIIKSLNSAIELVKGEYIARMDSDDICAPERFEKEVAILDSDLDVAMVTSHVMFIDENGNYSGAWAEDMETGTNEEIYDLLPKFNCLANPATMLRTSVLKRYKYNESQKDSEDWDLWLVMAADRLKFHKINETLVKYRVHSLSTTVKTHKEGVWKKIIRFKSIYIKTRLTKFKFKGTDYRVLLSLVQNSIRYYFPFLYAFIGKLYSTNIFGFVKQYRAAKRYFKEEGDSVTHIFFFPFYIVGGAEFVHSAILETVADRKPVVFITSRSGNNGMLAAYKKSATVIDVYYLLVWPFTKRWLTNKIKTICAQNDKLKLFSSNSKYYYELLASAPPGIYATDLIHAFVHDYEQGAESWSLTVTGKLVRRVVITHKTANDLRQLYKRNNIPDDLNNRIICIPNFVEMKENPKKREDSKLKVMYVGRGTSEKRIELISAVAKILGERYPEMEFHFVGNVKKAVPADDLKYCILHGEISDKTTLNKLYDEAHILVITSSREGFPISIMEAMMSGVVPVTTNVGGISEHVINNENGMLINGVTKEEIIRELVQIIEQLNNDRNKLNSLALNAYNYAIKHFNKKNFVDSYRNILID